MLGKYKQALHPAPPPRPGAVIFLVSSGCFSLRSNSLSLVAALPVPQYASCAVPEGGGRVTP